MKYLREMQPEDMKAVVAIIDSHDEDDAEEARAMYQEIGGIIDQFVLEIDGEIIGVTGFLTPPGCDNTHLLSWTYVEADSVNQGHGRRMLNDLIQHLKEQGGRKLFVKVSDYVDKEDGAIYAAALHLYKSMGFNLEITHPDFYDEGENQHILGLRLKDSESFVSQAEYHTPVTFNAVFEIAETDDAYSFGWTDDAETVFTQSDVEVGLAHVKEEEGRAVFLSFPSNYSGIEEPLISSGFTKSGILEDYFEDGLHEQHYTYRF